MKKMLVVVVMLLMLSQPGRAIPSYHTSIRNAMNKLNGKIISAVATQKVDFRGNVGNLGDSESNEYFYVQQQTDHFDAKNQQTWSQRYFANATFFEGTGPVFLCVGGEGPALMPDVVITGDVHCAEMMILAKELGALVFALEHRFYGKSLPTPDFSTDSLRLLSSRQALEDFSQWHNYVSEIYSLTEKNKWVTFGGSYPGMLASFMRLKYPNLVFASVSSSAPVEAQLNFQGYNDVVARSLSDPMVGGSDACIQAVRQSFLVMSSMFTTLENRNQLAKKFTICPENALEVDGNIAVFSNAIAGIFGVQENDPQCQSWSCGGNIESWCRVMTDTSAPPLEQLAFFKQCVEFRIVHFY